MAEIWRPVPSLPGMMVSNEGRFLLQPCYRPVNYGGFRVYLPQPSLGTVRRAKKGAKHCYYGTWVKRYGNLKIHQLVCEAFHGPKPFPKAVVIHIDENGLNNSAENLKWGTQKENLNAPGFLEYCKSEERKARLKRKAA